MGCGLDMEGVVLMWRVWSRCRRVVCKLEGVVFRFGGCGLQIGGCDLHIEVIHFTLVVNLYKLGKGLPTRYMYWCVAMCC